jgi:hypothetical protein
MRISVPSSGGDVRVLGAERLLPDRQAALVERLGLVVVTFGDVQRRQHGKADGDIRVLGPSAFSRIAKARL